jgi:transcriptional regulator with XRE-family HTH domain/lipopolysaccharide biosynthesis regulator YciM
MTTGTDRGKRGAVELATVGKRIADLRQGRGWSQKRLARASFVDNSHISRIERGEREPGRPVLERIATALGCTADYLLTGAGWAGDPRALDLELNFAELALRSGDDPAGARARFTAVLEQAKGSDDTPRATTALFGMSLAAEAEGDLVAALDGLQRLADEAELPPAVDRTYVHMMLCRTYMTLGDLNRAIDVGEAALRDYMRSRRPPNEQVIELASTLVGCYYERGDLVRAQMLVRQILDEAEAMGSAKARGAVYWNAAYVAQAQGDIREALRLTERALALFGEEGHRWATATLRRNAGWLLLQLPVPDHVHARPFLERALAELQEVGRPSDIAETEADLARCHLLAGDVPTAARLAAAAVERASEGPILEYAKARLVLADVALADGHDEEAVTALREAAIDLARVGASRHAATAWLRLGSLLRALQRHDEAAEAYERLADVIGLPETAPASNRARL